MLIRVLFICFLVRHSCFLRYFRNLKFYRGSYKWFKRTNYPEDFVVSGFSWDVELYILPSKTLDEERDIYEFWSGLHNKWRKRWES